MKTILSVPLRLCGLCVFIALYSGCLSDEAGKITPAPTPTPIPTQVFVPRFRNDPPALRTLSTADDQPIYPLVVTHMEVAR